MRDESELSVIYVPYLSFLPAWEALGLVVNIKALGVLRKAVPVTHLSLEVHRFLLRPIIRALSWPKEYLLIGPAGQLGSQQRYLLGLHDALLDRLRRRLQRLADGDLPRYEDFLDWHDLGGAWLLYPTPLLGFQERVWRGPEAERWPRPG